MSSELYEKVGEIQAAVNSEHAYKSDASGYGVGDYWDFMSPGDTGDCEDFALTKMQELLDYGVDVKNLQLMLCQVETGQHHAVLAIQTSNRGTLILDNRYNSVMLIGNVPYRFYTYQSAGTDFKSYTARLEAISIEYMNCNAAAFVDGDEVVVEFTEQDWNQSKVIGFKENPTACGGGVFVMEASYPSPQDYIVGWTYDPETDSYIESSKHYVTAMQRAALGAIGGAGLAYCMGGYIPNPWGPEPGWDTYKNDNIEYNSNTNVWLEKTDCLIENASAQCFNIGADIFLVGGISKPGASAIIHFDVDHYDNSVDSWTTKQDMLTGLTWFDVFVLSGKGYTIGGTVEFIDGPNILTDKIFEYNPVLDSHASKKTLRADWFGVSAFADFATNKGFFLGGTLKEQIDAYSIESSPGFWKTESCWEYDPVLNSITRVTNWGNEGYEIWYQSNPLPGMWVMGDEWKTDYDGYGPDQLPASGGYDLATTFQLEINVPVGYLSVGPQSYKPSTDVWSYKNRMPTIGDNLFTWTPYGNSCGI